MMENTKQTTHVLAYGRHFWHQPSRKSRGKTVSHWGYTWTPETVLSIYPVFVWQANRAVVLPRRQNIFYQLPLVLCTVHQIGHWGIPPKYGDNTTQFYLCGSNSK